LGQTELNFLKNTRTNILSLEKEILSIESIIESQNDELTKMSEHIESLPQMLASGQFEIPKESDYYSKGRLLEQKYVYWLNWPEGSYFRMSYYITGLFVLVSSLFSLVTDIGEALFLSAVVNIPLWLTCLLCLFLYKTLVNRRGNRSHIQWRGIVDVAYQSELERVQGWNEHYLHSIEKSLMDLQNANVELLESWNSIAHLMPK